MEEDLAKQWEGLCLTEKEKEVVVLPSNSTAKAMQHGQFCLLAMIIAEKPLNREAFKNTMSKVWRCESWIQFSEVGVNKFLIEFNKEKDLQRVIHGRPWSFDRWLLCLKVFDGNRSINEVLFNKEEFWVQAYNMPLASMTHDVGVQIGESIGTVITVQADERGIGWGEFLRIRVEVDISKALLRGMFLTVEGKKTWVHFKYERLPKFCFKCGVIKHSQQGCPVGSIGSGKLQYGVWMRAPAVKYSDNTKKKYGDGDCHHTEEGQSWRKGEEDRDEAPKGNAESKEDIQEPGLTDAEIEANIVVTEDMLISRNHEDSIKRSYKARSSETHLESSEKTFAEEGALRVCFRPNRSLFGFEETEL